MPPQMDMEALLSPVSHQHQQQYHHHQHVGAAAAIMTATSNQQRLYYNGNNSWSNIHNSNNSSSNNNNSSNSTNIKSRTNAPHSNQSNSNTNTNGMLKLSTSSAHTTTSPSPSRLASAPSAASSKTSCNGMNSKPSASLLATRLYVAPQASVSAFASYRSTTRAPTPTNITSCNNNNRGMSILTPLIPPIPLAVVPSNAAAAAASCASTNTNNTSTSNSKNSNSNNREVGSARRRRPGGVGGLSILQVGGATTTTVSGAASNSSNAATSQSQQQQSQSQHQRSLLLNNNSEVGGTGGGSIIGAGAARNRSLLMGDRQWSDPALTRGCSPLPSTCGNSMPWEEDTIEDLRLSPYYNNRKKGVVIRKTIAAANSNSLSAAEICWQRSGSDGSVTGDSHSVSTRSCRDHSASTTMPSKSLSSSMQVVQQQHHLRRNKSQVQIQVGHDDYSDHNNNLMDDESGNATYHSNEGQFFSNNSNNNAATNNNSNHNNNNNNVVGSGGDHPHHYQYPYQSSYYCSRRRRATAGGVTTTTSSGNGGLCSYLSCTNVIQFIVLLIMGGMILDSHSKVTKHKIELQQYDEERAHILEQMMWIDKAAKKVHKKYSSAGEGDLLLQAELGKATKEELKADVENARDELEKLQLRIQLNARDRIHAKFGDNPVQVALSLSSPGELADDGNNSPRKKIVIALSDDTPHAASTFLEQIDNHVWDDVHFQLLESGYAVQASTRKPSSTSPLLEFVERSRGCHEAGSVALHQLEEMELHMLVLRINIRDHAPVDEDDVCIGRVVSGMEGLARGYT